MNKVLTRAMVQPVISRVILYGIGATVSILLVVLYLGSNQEPTPYWPNDGYSNWGRDLGGVESVAAPDHSVVLREFAYINGELYAAGEYKNVDTRYGTEVHGVVTTDGRFWPKFRLLASSDGSKWHAVGSAPGKYGAMTKKVLVPGESFPAYVDLDRYKPLVNKYRYGRVVTENGQAIDFELGSLNAPKPSATLPSGQDKDLTQKTKND